MKMIENKADPAPDDMDSDHEMIMSQVAKEMMESIESKDKDKLLECFHCLVADLMQKMTPGQE